MATSMEWRHGAKNCPWGFERGIPTLNPVLSSSPVPGRPFFPDLPKQNYTQEKMSLDNVRGSWSLSLGMAIYFCFPAAARSLARG